MNQLQKLNQAEKWLAEAEGLDELKMIHDIAKAAEAYAQAHRLGIANENHARKIKFLAGRRIGELVPKEKTGPKEKEFIRNANKLNIAPPRLTEFRALAEVQKEKFDERLAVMEAREEKISYNKLLRGDWYQMSETPEWETPQWLFDLLNEEFHFEVDVCASEKNHKCEFYFSKETNCLVTEWPKICWMNPPYGRKIKDFMRKARIESDNGSTVVCLVPARPDTEWWWNNCIQGEIRFIRGRLVWPGSKTAAPFPSAVIVLKPKIKSKVIWWDVQK